MGEFIKMTTSIGDGEQGFCYEKTPLVYDEFIVKSGGEKN